MMDDMLLLKELPINKDLKPENCNTLGYEYLGDTIYDRESPLEAMQDIIDMVEKGKYFLGESATPNGYLNNFYGLYQALNSSK